MEGQKSPLRILKGLTVIAAICLLPQPLFAQAMGKVTLDQTAPPADTSPILQSQITLPAPLALPESKTLAPLLIPPVTPATLPAAGETNSAILSKPGSEKIPEKLTDKAPADSLPADPAKATISLRPIEHQEIRPHSPDAPAAPAAAAKSVLPPGATSVFQVFAALAVVIGLIFLGKALAKKFLPAAKIANAKGVIEILARYPLSKNQSLVLVRIGSQIVTLNQGKDKSHSVLVISDPNEVAKILGQIEGKNPNSIQAGFNKLLANARMDLEDPANDPDQPDFETRSMQPENLDTQLEEMAAAKRQLMELRQQVRSVRDSLPR